MRALPLLLLVACGRGADVRLRSAPATAHATNPALFEDVWATGGLRKKAVRFGACHSFFFLCHLRTATAVRARVDVAPRVAWHCACMSHAISHVHVAVENAHARALYVIHCAPPSALQEKERGSSGGPTMLASYHKRSSRRILTTPYIRSFLPHRRCTCCQSSTRQQRRQT